MARCCGFLFLCAGWNARWGLLFALSSLLFALSSLSVAMHDVGLEYVDGLVFGASLGDDEVGMAFGGFDELLVHGFQYLDVSFDDHFGGASALDGVAPDVADKAHVGIRVNIDFQVHKVAQVLAVQCHDTLYDNHLAGFYVYGLLHTVGGDVVVGGLLYGLALTQVADVLVEKFPVEGIGMVKVYLPAFLHGEVRVVVVVRILGDYRNFLVADGLHYFPYYCGLATTSASGYTYYIHC